jgi:hypothetical protein
VSCYVGDRTAETVASRPVKRHIWVASDSVNSLLQFYFKKASGGRKWRFSVGCDGVIINASVGFINLIAAKA